MASSRRRRLLRGLAIIGAVGCSGVATERTPNATIDTLSTGRISVTNENSSDWGPGGPWRLEEDLLLGEADAGGPEQFGRVTAVLMDSVGMIYVLDLLAQAIRVFHPSGLFSHTIGGKGEGPGELTGATEMVFGRGDTLWVVDPQENRYSAFARDGTFLTSKRRPIQRHGGSATFLRNGHFVDWGVSFPEEGPYVMAGGRVLLHPIRLSPGLQDSDSLPPLEYEREMMSNGTRPQPFFNNELVLSVDRAGDIWFAHSKEYRIYRRTLEGDTTLVFALSAEPVPVGDRERDYVRKRLARSPQLVSMYLNALPQTKPILHDILTDEAGHVYVFPELVGAEGASVVDVFSTTGVLLGRLKLPTPISLLTPQRLVAYVTADYLLLVVTDEADVPYVSRFRIVRGS